MTERYTIALAEHIAKYMLKTKISEAGHRLSNYTAKDMAQQVRRAIRSDPWFGDVAEWVLNEAKAMVRDIPKGTGHRRSLVLSDGRKVDADLVTIEDYKQALALGIEGLILAGKLDYETVKARNEVGI